MHIYSIQNGSMFRPSCTVLDSKTCECCPGSSVGRTLVFHPLRPGFDPLASPCGMAMVAGSDKMVFPGSQDVFSRVSATCLGFFRQERPDISTGVRAYKQCICKGRLCVLCGPHCQYSMYARTLEYIIKKVNFGGKQFKGNKLMSKIAATRIQNPWVRDA